MAGDRRGVAAMEFALVGGIVVVMLVAVFDLGLWIWEGMALEGALMAGVHYAQEFPDDAAGITSTITASLPPGLSNATITLQPLIRDCGSGASSNADGSCTPVTAQRVFVTLSISLPCSALDFTQITTTNVRYVIRVQ
jgi:Flp pilus assembly protein TadG